MRGSVNAAKSMRVATTLQPSLSPQSSVLKLLFTILEVVVVLFLEGNFLGFILGFGLLLAVLRLVGELLVLLDVEQRGVA